ncbi:hypothetical protein AB0O31_28725 [Kitasatospora cineracea]|uniref:hypothetical protein n=1 Tax=Kitasatospora cineracea TaxID=88074 RepID=UPI003442B102
MKLTSALRRSVPAVALLAALAGCSAAPRHDGPDADAGAPGGAVRSGAPSSSVSGGTGAVPAASGPVSASPFDPAAWPTEPVPAAKAPNPAGVPFGAGYDGQAYLDRLAATWGVAMKDREPVDFPGKPPSWHRTGRHEADGSALTVSAVWTQGGDLVWAACSATANAPKGAEFLADCARLDYPGSTPAATADWVRAGWPALDGAFGSGKDGVIDGPLRQSGTGGAVLQEGDDPMRDGRYRMVYLFGIGGK